jgi:hypothetical protein
LMARWYIKKDGLLKIMHPVLAKLTLQDLKQLNHNVLTLDLTLQVLQNQIQTLYLHWMPLMRC